jgi:hypothetical protein
LAITGASIGAGIAANEGDRLSTGLKTLGHGVAGAGAGAALGGILGRMRPRASVIEGLKGLAEPSPEQFDMIARALQGALPVGAGLSYSGAGDSAATAIKNRIKAREQERLSSL